MTSLRWIALIALKDLKVEFRSRGRGLAMAAFVVLACFLFAFSLDRALAPPQSVAGSLVWLTILFAATLGAGRVFDAEEEDGAFRHLLLAPVSRRAIFLGKAAANAVLVWITALLALAALPTFLGLRDMGSVLHHGAILLPGAIGLAAAGAFFGLVSRHSSQGETLLPRADLPAAGARGLLRGHRVVAGVPGAAMARDFRFGATALGVRRRVRRRRRRPLPPRHRGVR